MKIKNIELKKLRRLVVNMTPRGRRVEKGKAERDQRHLETNAERNGSLRKEKDENYEDDEETKNRRG